MMYEKSVARQYFKEVLDKYDDADTLTEIFAKALKDAIESMDFKYPNAILDYFYLKNVDPIDMIDYVIPPYFGYGYTSFPQDMTIPANVEKVGAHAFEGSNIETLRLSTFVKFDVENDVDIAANCANLSEIYINAKDAESFIDLPNGFAKNCPALDYVVANNVNSYGLDCFLGENYNRNKTVRINCSDPLEYPYVRQENAKELESLKWFTVSTHGVK